MRQIVSFLGEQGTLVDGLDYTWMVKERYNPCYVVTCIFIEYFFYISICLLLRYKYCILV